MFGERLIQMGFNGSEAKVYMALLSIGPQPVSLIAKRIDVNRTTTYAILRSLGKKGMVSSCQNGSMTFFRANDPNCLIAYLDSKARTFEYYKGEVLQIIPKLRQMSNKQVFKQPVVSFFEGIDGVQQVIYDALKAKGDFYMYMCEQIGNMPIMINESVTLKVIAPDTEKIRAFFETHQRNTGKVSKVLYVQDENRFPISESHINIYGDKVTIVNLNPGNEYAILIESPDVANMQRSIFEASWRGLID